MQLNTRYIEKETGLEVLLSVPQQWEGYPTIALITYPDGQVYAIPDADVNLYFEIVRPQEVRIVAAGGPPFGRPLPRQSALREQSEKLSIVP